MATVDELLIKIDASTELLRRELKRGGDSLEKFEKGASRNLSSIERRFGSFGKAIGNAVKGFVAAFTIREIKNFTTAAIEQADAVAKAAQVADFAGERFQRLSFVFQQSGVGSREFELALQKLNRRLGLFISSGGGPAARALEELGLATEITSGRIQTSEQLFDAFVLRLESVDNAAKRAALTSELFGEDAGPKLVAALSMGTQALGEAADAVEGVFSDQQLARAEALNDAINRVSTNIGVKLKGAAIDAAVALARIFDFEEITGLERLSNLGIEAGVVEFQIHSLANEIDGLRERLGAASEFAPDVTRRILGVKQGELEALQQRLRDINAEIKTLKEASAPAVGSAQNPADLQEVFTPNVTRKPGPFPVPPIPRDEQFGPFLTPDKAKELENQLFQLQQAALRAQGEMETAIRRAADRQIEEWRRVAEETPEAASTAAEAIVAINTTAAEQIKDLAEKAEKPASQFASAFAAAFESRGMEALLEGDLSNAVKGLVQDIIQLIVRLTILKPLAESLEGLFSGDGGGGGGGGGGFLGGLTTVFNPGARATGGPVGAGSPYVVGEGGPELFLPNVAGRVFTARQAAMAGMGSTVNNYFDVQAGLPPQWAAQLHSAIEISAGSAAEITRNRQRGRR